MGHRAGVPEAPLRVCFGAANASVELLESTILWFFNLRVVNVQTFALWVFLGFLDVREGRPGVFRDKVYWWVGFFVENHAYWGMSGEGGVFRALGTPVA